MDEKSTRMLFVTAALSALAAVLAGPASAYIPEGDGVNPVSVQSQVRESTQAVDNVAIPYLSQGIGVDKSQFNSGTQAFDDAAIPYLSHGVGVDKTLFSGQTSRVDAQHAALALNREAKAALALDPAIRTAIEARADDSQRAVSSGSTAQLPHGLRSEPLAVESESTAALPHGLRSEPLVVGSSQSNEPSLGLTGDSPLTRVSAPEPEGLTGDSAATRYPRPATEATVSGGGDIDWTSFGVGAGMAALLAAGFAGVLLTMRKRHTVGLP